MILLAPAAPTWDSPFVPTVVEVAKCSVATGTTTTTMNVSLDVLIVTRMALSNAPFAARDLSNLLVRLFSFFSSYVMITKTSFLFSLYFCFQKFVKEKGGNKFSSVVLTDFFIDL